MDEYQKEDADGANFNIVSVDGNPPNLWELPDEKSNVAVPYTTAMAYPTPLFVFRTIRDDEGAIQQLLFFLLGMEPVPRTVGVSFNYFLERQLPRPEASYMCNLFFQFSARGSSVLVVSGNDGVGAAEDCYIFDVDFPSSCMCDFYSNRYTSVSISCSSVFRRSLGHQRRWHSKPRPRDCNTPLRRRIFNPLSTPRLPVQCSARFPH